MLGISLELFIFYVVCSLALGLLYAYLLYRNEKSIASRNKLSVLFIFRTFFVSFICFLLLSPIIKSIIYSVEEPIIIIAKDDSESIRDSIVSDLKTLKKDLDGFDVHTYSFSDDIVEGFLEKNTGLRTNFSDLFLRMNNKYENRNVLGMVFASDGCYNIGKNPEFLQYDFPVYSIALGDTTQYKDISIDNVLYNEVSFLGNTFPLEISILSKSSQNEKTKLTIWQSGVKLYEEIIDISSDNNLYKVNVKLNASKLGLNTYKIQLDPLKGERNLYNNTYLAYIDVIESRYNILILKGDIHPDIAAFKSVLDKNKNYKLNINNIDQEINNIDSYHLIVLFRINNIPLYLTNVDIPLIVFHSKQLDYNLLGSSVSFSSKGSYEEVFAAHNNSFSKFTFSSELIELIANAPPLYSSFGRFYIDQKIDYVLNKKKFDLVTDDPVIFIEDIDSRKIAFLPAEGWWRWKLYDYSVNDNNDQFDELFSKLTQYLVVKEDKSLFRINYDNIYQEDNYISIEAELYNESYELVNDSEVKLTILDIENNEYEFQFSRFGEKYMVDVGSLPVGSYNLIAEVLGSDLRKKGKFDVQKIQLEQLDIVANHQVLNKISSISGGKMFYKQEINILLNELNNSSRNKKVIFQQEKFNNLINIYWILVVLLMLISLEWFLRKYYGII